MEMMKSLLSDFDADISASTTSGETVFHLAVRLENVSIAQLLVDTFEERGRRPMRLSTQ